MVTRQKFVRTADVRSNGARNGNATGNQSNIVPINVALHHETLTFSSF